LPDVFGFPSDNGIELFLIGILVSLELEEIGEDGVGATLQGWGERLVLVAEIGFGSLGGE
jgi:hypothetical protein